MASRVKSNRGRRSRDDAEGAGSSAMRRATERVARARAAARSVREAAREVRDARRAARLRSKDQLPPAAHLSLLRAPARPRIPSRALSEVRIATYNVHRWTGMNGRRAPDPARAGYVISEIEADVIALQEVLRPSSTRLAAGFDDEGDDPLIDLSEALGLHLVFAVTREHKRGQLGNAILSRLPVSATSVLDISYSRLERRGALAAQLDNIASPLGVVATHLSLVDRTRQRQVQSLLTHPQITAGPCVLMGDMNAWRQCKATRELDESLRAHHNLEWPPSFPAAAPVLALDRIYARGAKVVDVYSHDTPAARRASDHLPVIATVALED